MIPLMAKRTTRPPTHPPATPASISPGEGIALLQELLERGSNLLQRAPREEEMDVYRTELNSALDELTNLQRCFMNKTGGYFVIWEFRSKESKHCSRDWPSDRKHTKAASEHLPMAR